MTSREMPRRVASRASTNNPSTHARSALLRKLVARGLFLDAYLRHGRGIHGVGAGGREQRYGNSGHES